MSILNFFSPSKKPSELVEDVEDITPRECEEITHNLKKVEGKSAKRGKYRTWTFEEKLEIGNYAIKNGVASTTRNLSKKYPGLSKQSVSDFKKVSFRY